ncbi:MAG: YafY family transcriptional regulator [Oscillospiraceae bacterium]|nr:YafY family transcriptional regulator [Oscillospiraceae bacterium]
MQISRLFEIVYILLDKQRVTARELAEHFGVSRQTICRDIDTLSTAGIPIYTERGKGGGIRLLPEFVLNKSILNEREQTEILSALQGLSTVKTGDTDQILQKLSTVFNRDMTDWLKIDFSDWSHEHIFFNDFKRAILERFVITFDYYNSYGDQTFRRIEPIQFWYKSRAWYLKGYCLTKQGVRLYKLTRIKNPVVTSEHFAEREALTSSDDSIDQWDEQPTVTLKLRITPEATYRVHDDFSDSEIEKQPDGSYLVSTTFTEDQWVRGFLLSYGKQIEVLEPEHMRDIMKEETQEILKKYL